MLVDLHMHSRFSFDAQPDTVQDIAAASIKRGLSTIVISDHKDYFWKQRPMGLDIAGVQAEIDAARAQYGGRIEILKGIELGEPARRSGGDGAAESVSLRHRHRFAARHAKRY